MLSMDSQTIADVKMYSVILGFSMIVIFILPCVLLAFFSKYLVRSSPTPKVGSVARYSVLLRAILPFKSARAISTAYVVHIHACTATVGPPCINQLLLLFIF